MICWVSSSTKLAVFGSSAAVCSSSSSMLEGVRLAISRLTAWRWPPESRPILSPRRFSRPSFSVARLSRNCPRYCFFTALVRPRLWPRLMASARFSSMDRFSQVPARGSWNTRATRAARLWVGRRVTSRLSTIIWPLSTMTSPARAFRKVDFPAPLLPMTVTNSPWFTVRLMPRRAGFSSGVPLPKVSRRSVALIIVPPQAFLLVKRLAILVRTPGSTMARVTRTAVIRFRSCACRPRTSAFRAKAMASR